MGIVSFLTVATADAPSSPYNPQRPARGRIRATHSAMIVDLDRDWTRTPWDMVSLIAAHPRLIRIRSETIIRPTNCWTLQRIKRQVLGERIDAVLMSYRPPCSAFEKPLRLERAEAKAQIRKWGESETWLLTYEYSNA